MTAPAGSTSPGEAGAVAGGAPPTAPGTAGEARPPAGAQRRRPSPSRTEAAASGRGWGPRRSATTTVSRIIFFSNPARVETQSGGRQPPQPGLRRRRGHGRRRQDRGQQTASGQGQAGDVRQHNHRVVMANTTFLTLFRRGAYQSKRGGRAGRGGRGGHISAAQFVRRAGGTAPAGKSWHKITVGHRLAKAKPGDILIPPLSDQQRRQVHQGGAAPGPGPGLSGPLRAHLLRKGRERRTHSPNRIKLKALIVPGPPHDVLRGDVGDGVGPEEPGPEGDPVGRVQPVHIGGDPEQHLVRALLVRNKAIPLFQTQTSPPPQTNVSDYAMDKVKAAMDGRSVVLHRIHFLKTKNMREFVAGTTRRPRP